MVCCCPHSQCWGQFPRVDRVNQALACLVLILLRSEHELEVAMLAAPQVGGNGGSIFAKKKLNLD